MNVFEAAADAWKTGRRAAFATVVDQAGSVPRVSGARMLVYDDGAIVGTIGGGEVEHRVIALAREVIGSGKPARFVAHLTRDLGMCCGGNLEVYVEPLQIREPFVLFGAGHVAMAVAPVLRALDYEVTVVDEREELATAERFPGCRIERVDAVGFARAAAGGPDAWWLVVTHDHRLDQELIEVLLPKPCAWLGMIGSRAKVAKFLMRLRAAGVDEAHFRKLCAPVGLDIGAETPAEIAVSVAAELVRVRRDATSRPPVPLSSIPIPARGGDGVAVAPRSVR